MTELKRYKFSDLYEMSSGISTKPEQAGKGYPFISFSTIFNNYFIPFELPDLMDSSEDDRIKYSVKEGDILLTRTSETVDELGMSSVVIQDIPNVTFSGFAKRLRPTQSDITYHKFMAFYLRSKLFRKTMTNNALMTLRASLNEQIFSYLELLLPDYNTQKKIGDLLFNINSKIAINNKINKNLESMVKTIYNYWFVQFDFPDENSKPYKESGGVMVYNKILKKDIPIGWKNGIVDDIADIVRGVSYNKNDIKTQSDKNVTPILRATNITGNIIDLNNMVYVPNDFVSDKQLLNEYEVLLTMSSGSINHIGKNGLFYYQDKVGFGAFCAKLVSKKDYTFYLSSYMQSEFVSETIKKECLGTNINNLNGALIKGFRVVKPNKNVLESFNTKIKPFHKSIGINLKANQRLVELRDWLLPMLINGQVTFKEAQEYINQAAEPQENYG